RLDGGGEVHLVALAGEERGHHLDRNLHFDVLVPALVALAIIGVDVQIVALLGDPHLGILFIHRDIGGVRLLLDLFPELAELDGVHLLVIDLDLARAAGVGGDQGRSLLDHRKRQVDGDVTVLFAVVDFDVQPEVGSGSLRRGTCDGEGEKGSGDGLLGVHGFISSVGIFVLLHLTRRRGMEKCFTGLNRRSGSAMICGAIMDETWNLPLPALAALLDRPLVVLDAGCRWGFAEAWEALGAQVELIGFDADAEECRALGEGVGESSVRYVAAALGAAPGPAKLYVTREPACSSLYPPDPELVRERPELACTALASVADVELTTLDAWAAGASVSAADFLKLDTQGSELDILRGGERLLATVRA